MASLKRAALGMGLTVLGAAGMVGCRTHMPHRFTWPAGGDIEQTHAKPPEGGYYCNWDPYAVELEITPLEDVNPVRTQHVFIATVKDKNGKPLPISAEPKLVYQQTKLPSGEWFPAVIRMNADGDGSAFFGLNWDVVFDGKGLAFFKISEVLGLAHLP